MAKRSRKKETSPESVHADLAKGKLAPVYLLLGQDEVEKTALLKAILDAAVEPAARAFNVDVLHGDDADITDVVNRASAFPMMTSRRAVVLRRVDRLQDDAERQLLPLVQNPMDTTVLVFTAEKVDGRKKLYQDMRKVGVAVDFKLPYDNEVPGWIQRRGKDMGIELGPEATHLLHMAVGASPSDLRNELEKLVIHADGRTEITREDVAWVVSASRENSIFELTDAVGERRTGDAIRIAEHLVAQGEHPVRLVYMIIRHVGILRKAHWLLGARLQKGELASRLKVPGFYLDGYVKQARGFNDDLFRSAFGALSKAESLLKSRPRTQYATILTRTIAAICGSDPSAPNGRPASS